MSPHNQTGQVQHKVGSLHSHLPPLSGEATFQSQALLLSQEGLMLVVASSFGTCTAYAQQAWMPAGLPHALSKGSHQKPCCQVINQSAYLELGRAAALAELDGDRSSTSEALRGALLGV